MYAIFVLLFQRPNFLDPLIYATSENKRIKLHTFSRLSPRRIGETLAQNLEKFRAEFQEPYTIR